MEAYLIDDDLAEKIISIIPSVENIDGDLRGLMTVILCEKLTESETETLRKELLKQLDSGWGEDFNEETVNIGGKYVYIVFLCAKDGEKLHILSTDDDINQTMGGI